jgi:protoporphyrinogen oxidase
MSERGTILIAGAGLAGLAAAFHLSGRDYRIIEKEGRPGGLCRTERSGRHAFDYGGHLLHLRGDDIKALVRELLGDRVPLHQRRAAIFSQGVFTPYPFQVNTHGLPAEAVRDCLLGFVEALLAARERPDAPDNFFDWIHYAFGAGFAQRFFLPFNQKFFKLDLHELTTEWAQWSVPRPELRDVVNGALGIREREFGYNPEFYYPAEGIEQLPRALTARLERPVETGVELVELITSERRARLSNGEQLPYGRMIATLPLDRLLALTVDLPAELRTAAQGLRVLSVACVNLGLRGGLNTDQHWVYVPEAPYRFHRIGVYSNFMPAPAGSSSLYLEVSLPGPVSDPLRAEVVPLMEEAMAQFQGVPVWDGDAGRIEEKMTMLIPHAYVIYDRHRERWLPRMISWYAERGIELAGRYARWEYATMEDALRQGKEVATHVARI